MSYSDTEWEAWAAANAQALSSGSDWLLRKRDRVALNDAVMTRRTLEVEFAIPSVILKSHLDRDRVPLVVAYVAKRRLGPVQVTDAAGVLLSTFNSTEAARFNEAVLTANASQVVGRELLDQAPPAEWRALIADILSTPESTAARASRQKASDASGQPGADIAGQQDATSTTPRAEHEWQTRARETLTTNDAFMAWVAALTTHDPVVIELNAEDRSRRVVRVAYDMNLDRTQTPHDVQPGLWRRLGQTIGWSETRAAMSIPGIEASSAYEIDINTPDGIELTAVSVSRSDGQQGDEPPSASASAATLSARFARVSFPAVPPSATLLVQFRLRPQRSYPLAVLLTSVAAGLVLTAGWLRLRTVAGSADAATALLLALPAFFTTLVARPGRGTPAASMCWRPPCAGSYRAFDLHRGRDAGALPDGSPESADFGHAALRLASRAAALLGASCVADLAVVRPSGASATTTPGGDRPYGAHSRLGRAPSGAVRSRGQPVRRLAAQRAQGGPINEVW